MTTTINSLPKQIIKRNSDSKKELYHIKPVFFGGTEGKILKKQFTSKGNLPNEEITFKNKSLVFLKQPCTLRTRVHILSNYKQFYTIHSPRTRTINTLRMNTSESLQ